MKIDGFDVQRIANNRGWLCEISYRVTTADQFTDVCRSAFGDSRWWLLSILKAWWQARKLAEIERAKPGERESKGWPA